MVDRPEGDGANGWGGLPPFESRGWTLLTNHAHVLLCIRNDPTIRVRDIAYLVGITERAAHKIVGDLGEAGYVTRTKVGRRNQYTVHREAPMRHPLERHQVVGELLDALADPRTQASTMAAQN
jgi:DNA-binding IclR family transcriptional regulator